MKKMIVILVSLLSIPLLVSSQRSTQRMYTMDDGLYQSTVNGAWMTYDSLFYVWDNNKENGMTRFDGYHFEDIKGCGISPYILSGMKNFADHSLIFNYGEGYFLYQNQLFENILDLSLDSPIKDSLYGFWIGDQHLFIATLDKQIYKYEITSREWVFDRQINTGFHKELDSLIGSGISVNYRESTDGEIANVNGKYFSIMGADERPIELPPIIELPRVTDLVPKKSVNEVDSRIWQQLCLRRSFEQTTNYLPGESDYCQVMREGDGTFYLIEYSSEGDVKNYGTVNGANVMPLKLNSQSIFVSSHDGLQRINPKIKYFPSSSPDMVGGLYSILESNDGSIWMGGYGTGFSVYDGQTFEKIEGRYSSAFVMPGSRVLADGSGLFLQDNSMHGLYRLTNDSIELLRFKRNESSLRQQGYYIKELQDHSVAIGNPNSTVSIISEIEDTSSIEYITRREGLRVKNVLCIEEDHKGRLWLGHPSTGVDLYDRDEKSAFNYTVTSDNSKSFGAMSMLLDSEGRLWIGSRKGLKVLREASSFDPEAQDLFGEVESITLPNGDFSLPMFLFEVDNYIVCGTKKAVSFIDKKSYSTNPNNPIIYQLIYGEDIEGNGSQQNCVLFDSQRRLWIGSNEGASMMMWDQYVWDHTTNKIDIKSIIAGTSEIELSKDELFTLPVDNRNFKIQFGLKRNPSLLKNVFFDYSLLNEQEDTLQHVRFDQNGELDIAYLQPGSYTLHIDARKHGQLIDSRKVDIKVPLSISENPYYWGALFLLLISLMGGFFWLKSKQNKLLLRKQLELSQSQSAQRALSVQAIISSFNPHFINNSLHWVQSKYRKDKDMTTVVGRLSENTRYIFDKTKRGEATHTLREELRIVDNYIQIQLVRFKDTFEYRPPSREMVELLGQYPIFLMMLQIHVENAIEHGLRNRRESTYVSLDITDKEKSILIKIEDDGVGRTGAKLLGSKGTESGVKMLTDLILIFNKANSEEITMSYNDDIYEDQGEKFGTLVVISIPKRYDFNL